MKPLFLTTLCLLTTFFLSAQIKYVAGPELDNDRDSKMNRIIGGDDKSFYCYRIRSKGRGTSFFVEKYDKKTLNINFSQEISLEGEDEKAKFINVLYAQGNVYIFRRRYDKDADKMTLYYQTVSSTGKVSTKLAPIVSAVSDHYEYINFEVYPTPDNTRFLVKSCHKPNKDTEYKTDFILFDAAKGMTKKWTKTVNQQLIDYSGLFNSLAAYGFGFFPKELGFVGLYIDNDENLYYCYSDHAKNSTEKENRYELHMCALNANETKTKTVDLKFDDNYEVTDVEFYKGDNNSMVVGGFAKDVIERKGRDLVKVGIFSFKVDLNANKVVSNAINFFDDTMLEALESNNKKSRYLKYKLDYILPIGDAVYYVGEQYRETRRTRKTGTGFGSLNSSYWDYEYMDVIVAKLSSNSSDKFEWVKNAPLRNSIVLEFPHVFKQYIAIPTAKNLYILCNDHPKNLERYEKSKYEPEDLKSVTTIHGSNFVSNAVDLKTGKIVRSVVFENEKYCFAPIQERNPQFIPPSETEIFLPGAANEIYIYTEDRGRDQFGRITF